MFAEAEAAAFVHADSLGDHLRRERVVLEAVGGPHLSAVPVDVHGPLVARLSKA